MKSKGEECEAEALPKQQLDPAMIWCHPFFLFLLLLLAVCKDGISVQCVLVEQKAQKLLRHIRHFLSFGFRILA